MNQIITQYAHTTSSDVKIFNSRDNDLSYNQEVNSLCDDIGEVIAFVYSHE